MWWDYFKAGHRLFYHRAFKNGLGSSFGEPIALFECIRNGR